MRRRGWLLIVAGFVSACASRPYEDGNTLRSLENRSVPVDREAPIEGSRDKAIQAYRKYLEVAPRDSLRPEAMRRLGDMEIDSAEQGAGTERQARQDYQQAIETYQKLLRQHPDYPVGDRVLYQLARGYEQSGELKAALATLDRLVAAHPQSTYVEEAQFRRGELLFTLRDYEGAEQAYSHIVQRRDASPYYERSLYMRGWSHFKQSRYDEALNDYFTVLDRKLLDKDSNEPLEQIASLTRADRELTEDTFRVVSLSLAGLRGPESIPGYFRDSRRRGYEFRVYEQLGDLYFKQQRVKDAADTYNAFARRYPTHPQAPLLQVRVIESYQQAGFAALAIEAKKEFVVRYGLKSEFRKVNGAAAYEPVQPHVRRHLEELARHYHATAQKSRDAADYREAERWYRVFLESFPSDPQAPVLHYMFADLLYEQKRYGAAADEYMHTAYVYPRHARSADAGYAALQAYGQHEKALAGKDKDQARARRRAVDAALSFSDSFPDDARTPAVLGNAAEQLYAEHETERAIAVAERLLARTPPVGNELRRTAWTVVAHSEFDRGRFDRAETGYRQVLGLTDPKSPNRGVLTERLAASIYKQGEQARAAGRDREAAGHFLRVAQVVPGASVVPAAQYDAAASLIAVKDWNAAAGVLEGFRRNYPKHPLQAEVPGKLAVVYLESGQVGKAAAEFEAIAAGNKDVRFSREALWQAAELYEKAGQDRSASLAYERYVRQHPRPLEPAIEARFRLAKLGAKGGQEGKRLAWSRELLEAERAGGGERTDRTRYLGAQCALLLAEPVDGAYREVRLVEPLKKNLKLKKERMEKALEAYGVVADYGVAEFATAAVYRSAELYADFGKALMQSQRPKGLKADELEQYNVLLEEQAFPFEEKAAEVHEINTRRATQGIYDQSVRNSYAALARLRPVRYGKSEKGEGVIRAIR